MLNPEYTISNVEQNAQLSENLQINQRYFDKDSSLSKGLKNIVVGGLIFSIIITFVLILQISLGPSQIPSRIGIITQDERCTKIGADMVRNGGNSIDAYISSSLCLAVVNPFSAGLGAGGFLVIRDHKHDKNLAINCFLKSGSNESMLVFYKNRPASGKLSGYESIAIPGEFKCLQFVYHKFSRFNWNTLAMPAINLAFNGFTVSKLLADNLRNISIESLNNNPTMRDMFTRNGELVKEGDTIKNQALSRALRSLIDDDNNLYNGHNMTKNILEATQRGQIKMSDLNGYSIDKNQLLTAKYKDFLLLTVGFPSNGPILKFILNLMSQLNINIDNFKTSKFYSQFIQAVQLGYLLQSNTADPNTNKASFDALTSTIDDAVKLYAQTIALNNTINMADYKISNFNQNDDIYTNFISVNDHNDLMVSYVGTLGSLWGSQIMTNDGYFLNNGYNLFSFENDEDSNPQNFVGLNKQPRGLMAPIITYNTKNPCMRRFVVSYTHSKTDDFGITSLTQVILKLFTDLSYYPSVVSDKRIEYEASNVCFEDGFDNEIENGVSNYFKGTSLHLVNSTECSFDAINLIMKKDPILYGEVDANRTMYKSNMIVFNS